MLSVRDVIRIKSRGLNNFIKNHFKSSNISGHFSPIYRHSQRTFSSGASTLRGISKLVFSNVSDDLIPACLNLSWDNESQPAPTSLSDGEKKSPLG
jgi:hypothetical protein